LKRISLWLVTLSFLLAGVARADSTGVPFLDGVWQGKIKAKIYDQTIPGSNDRRFKYNSQIDVDIVQAEESDVLTVTVFFNDPLPVGTAEVAPTLTLGGRVGNFHMNMAGEEDGVTMVGSGDIDKKAKQIRMTGTAATSDYTIEFKLKVKRLND
jgi:hypothetical protein